MSTDPQWFANQVALAAACFSVIAIILSGVSVWFSGRQALAAEKQAIEAKAARQLTEKAMADQAEALRRQGEIAEISVKASSKSAAAAEESARLSAHAQRAWVTISGKDDQLYQGYEGQDQFYLKIQLTNTGQTPAIDVALKQHLEYEYPTGVLHNEAEVERSSASLGFGATVEISCVLHISTNAQREIMKNSGCKVEAFGQADYKDVFGSPHSTKWRYGFDYKELRFVSLPNGNALS